MRRYKNLLFLAGSICMQLCNLLHAQTNSGALIAGDFADPSIIKAKDAYYATGTSSEWAPHFPIYTSKDLQNWKLTGYVFDKAPEWTTGSFWAPEYYFYNNTYYVYYTARRKSDRVSCIGVATSQYPDKGFKDHGVIVSYGKEAIDGFVYNDSGQLYMTFKAYGLDDRPIEILGCRLSADGLTTGGEVFSLLKDNNRMGMEGQSILKKDGYYYLFYSAGSCCGNGCSYNVRVARSKHFKGPYEDYSRNPILQTNEVWKCPGHGTFVEQQDGKQVYIHHAYNKESNVFTGREGMLAELVWSCDNGWPSLVSRQNRHSSGSNMQTSFTEKKIAGHWQWDFRHATPVISQENGRLSLSGTIKEGNSAGIALTVRPVSRLFEIITTVENRNAALKGLVFYGDANAAIGIGTVNDNIEYWMVRDNKRTVLATQKISGSGTVQLKLAIKPGPACEVFYKYKGTAWQQIAPEIKPGIGFLPQWDRSPRPGLHFKGSPNEQAVFSGFELVNR